MNMLDWRGGEGDGKGGVLSLLVEVVGLPEGGWMWDGLSGLLGNGVGLCCRGL